MTVAACRRPTAPVGVGHLDQIAAWARVIEVKSSYAIHEAKARFSELVRVVKSGRELVITERGRPVARLVGVPDHARLADRLRDLQAQGVLTAFPDDTGVALEPIARRRGAVKRFLAER
jgi:prevent-host-death family protein